MRLIIFICLLLFGCDTMKKPARKIVTEPISGKIEFKTLGYEYLTIDGKKYVQKVYNEYKTIAATGAGTTLYVPSVVVVNNNRALPVLTNPVSIALQSPTRVIPILFSQQVTEQVGGGLAFQTAYNFSTPMLSPNIGILNNDKVLFKYQNKISPHVVIQDNSINTALPAPPGGSISWCGNASLLNYSDIKFMYTDFAEIDLFSGVEFWPKHRQATYLNPLPTSIDSNNLITSYQLGYITNNANTKLVSTQFFYFEIVN